MCKKLFFIIINLSLFTTWAQDAPIGQFKEYLSYNKFQSVAQDKENIYAATDQSIMVVDKEDRSLSKWSKLNGLSDVGIKTIHNSTDGQLIIAYINSNIDVIKDYKVYNIRDILNKQLTGSKAINHIYTHDGFAYLSCDFGVVILDLESLLIKDSWFTVRQNETYFAQCLTIHNHHYYLATNQGVFSLPDSALNAADFSTWKLESELPQTQCNQLCSYDEKLFAVYSTQNDKDTLFVYENSIWKTDTSIEMQYYKSFDVKNGKMLVCDRDYVKVFTHENYEQYDCYWDSYAAILDENMNIWVADNSSGLLFIDTQNNSSKIYRGEGPANNSAYNMCFTNGILAVVPGTRSNAIIPDWNTPGAISTLNEGKWWTRYNFDWTKRGFNSVVINPLNPNEIFIASWVRGLYKINKDNNETFCYDSTNSPLISERENGAIFLSGLSIDKQNNLWMLQTEVRDLIKVKELNTQEEKWHSFNLFPYETKGDAYAEHLLIDSRNYKWITLPRTNQLVVFFENGSLTNDALHKKAEVDLASQVINQASRITCITEDKEGRIWTGSDQGIKVIYDAASVFNRTIYAKNILIEQQGIGDSSYVEPLFAYEYITCITVDDADRKWIGTRNAGAFLISPSGTQELFHFNTDNSPLFSNQINDIKINPENGEVFFATEGGLISYKGTATVGKENYKEILVYPNPVREDYYGPIAVKGLMENSFCKITDAAGNLVWQGYAYGGQLIWNGKDFYGKRPATGVYFVMATSKTGKEKKVAKFLLITAD